uniref:Uncharacterized protein n=1 Tax=Vannella robusta TaxID=1487602 RepID=A0A7S4IF12_9EUKA
MMLGCDGRPFYLKQIIKENHGGCIRAVCCNRRAAFGNVVASLSDYQLNIYDSGNEDHDLDLFLYFKQSQKLRTMMWLDVPYDLSYNSLYSKLPSFDTHMNTSKTNRYLCYLAVSGNSKSIDIISITKQKIVQRLCGHSKAVIDIVQPYYSSKEYADLVISASVDGAIYLWHWPTGNLLHSISLSCRKFCVNESKEGSILCITNKGKLQEIQITAISGIVRMQLVQSFPMSNTFYDNIQYNKNKEIAVCKSSKGKIVYWKLQYDGNQVPQWIVHTKKHIPHLAQGAGFSISVDGNFLCLGNDTGSLFVFDFDSLQLLQQLDNKSQFTSKDCSFSDTGSIYQVGNSPHLLRWQPIDPDAITSYKQQITEPTV